MAGRSAGRIAINLTAGTAALVVDLEKGKAAFRDYASNATRSVNATGTALRQIGSHGVSDIQAASAAIRVMEGGMTNNLRAVERFVAGFLGLGPTLQKIFPFVGAFAFTGLIVHLGEELHDFFKSITDAPAKLSNAFRDLNIPLSLTNDQLRVANERLELNIAKLEGRRGNTLALALAEARKAADELAESLQKDLEGLQKINKENELSWFKALVTGQKATTGEEEGINRLQEQLSAEMIRSNEKLRGAKTEDEKSAATLERNINLQKILNGEIERREALLKQAEATQLANLRNTPAERLRWSEAHPAPTGGQFATQAEYEKAMLAHNAEFEKQFSVPAGRDQSKEIKTQRSTIDNLKGELERMTLLTSNADLTAHHDALKNDQETRQRPYLADELEKINAQLSETKGKLAAVGKGDEMLAIAKGTGEALKIITRLNQEMAAEKFPSKRGAVDGTEIVDGVRVLTDASKDEITSKEIAIAGGDAQISWQTRIDSTTKSLAEQVRIQNLLTEAIGKGYEVSRVANIEMETLRSVGGARYDSRDAETVAGVAAVREQVAKKYDADRRTAVGQRVYDLTQTINLENKLAGAQSLGAAAVRRITQAEEVRQLIVKGNYEEAAALEKKYAAERANTEAKSAASIEIKINSINRLTAAEKQGADAVREVEAALAREAAIREDKSPEQADREASVITLDHHKQVTKEVYEQLYAYDQALTKIQERWDVLQQVTAEEKKTAAFQAESNALMDEMNRLTVDELLRLGTISDGWSAFWYSMQEKAEKPGKILYDTMKMSVDRLSDDLTKLLTGDTRGGIGKMFGQTLKDVGQHMVSSAIKAQIQLGLGAIGRKIKTHVPGIGGVPVARADGQTPATALWVQMVRPPGVGNLPGDPTIENATTIPVSVTGAGDAGDGKKSGGGGWLGGLLGAIFGGSGAGGGADGSATSTITYGGALRDGGDVSPDRDYLVGDGFEPEIFTPGVHGRVTPLSKLEKAGGNVSIKYDIDARGADLGAENRIRRGMELSYKSSVSTAIQANHEYTKRTPQK